MFIYIDIRLFLLWDHVIYKLHVHASILKYGYQSAKEGTKGTKETTDIS